MVPVLQNALLGHQPAPSGDDPLRAAFPLIIASVLQNAILEPQPALRVETL